MPSYVLLDSNSPEGIHNAPPSIEAFRTCQLKPYKKIKVPSFKVTEEVIAYASPDSTYAVTKQFLEAAEASILIGIYDFTAEYMKTLLLNAMSRGVKVTLMLDVEKTGGEEELFNELIAMGVDGVPAPACTSKKIHYFSSCHEKFIVIDGTWTLVQSGNYSNNSIPLNEKDGGDPNHFVTGNRDTGLAIKSKEVAAFFTKLLQSDIALELNAAKSLVIPPPMVSEAIWIEAAPAQIPKRLFPSKRFKLTSPLMIQPVLSPDNYMATIPGILRTAKHSILIEQQYIRASQPGIATLLAAIREAMDANPKLDVRIVLGKIFGAEDAEKERENVTVLKSKFGLTLGDNLRYINTDRLVHCHNKLIIIDDATVLVSSQNWSDTAVSLNREAGLLLTHKDVAAYFKDIFEIDWETAFKDVPTPGVTGRKDAKALRSGGFIQLMPADHREV